MLFLVAELINEMIEQYQTTGVKYHFHPVNLISIKHLIHQPTIASKHFKAQTKHDQNLGINMDF